MINVNFGKTIDNAIKGYAKMQKQQQFAMRVAISRTAAIVAKAERNEIGKVFDNPTAFTRRAVLNVEQRVGKGYVRFVKIRDEATKGTPPSKYLAPQEAGGERRFKRFERAFTLSHIEGGDREVLTTHYFIPGKGARLNKAGNVTPGKITQILSDLRMHNESGYKANSTKRSRARNKNRPKYYFGYVGNYKSWKNRGGRKTLGIWEIDGDNLKPIFIAAKKKPHYKPIFKFAEVGQRIGEAVFPDEYNEALEQALRTAR